MVCMCTAYISKGCKLRVVSHSINLDKVYYLKFKIAPPPTAILLRKQVKNNELSIYYYSKCIVISLAAAAAAVSPLILPWTGSTRILKCTRWSRRTKSPVYHLDSPTPLKCCKKSWRPMREVRQKRITKFSCLYPYINTFFVVMGNNVKTAITFIIVMNVHKVQTISWVVCVFVFVCIVLYYRGSPAVAWEAITQHPKNNHISRWRKKTPHLWKVWHQYCVSLGSLDPQ